jgi:hypothetical protein
VVKRKVGRPVGSKNKPKKVKVWRIYKLAYPAGAKPKKFKWNPYTGTWVFWGCKESLNWRTSRCDDRVMGDCGGEKCAYYHTKEEQVDSEAFTYDQSKVEVHEFKSIEEYEHNYSIVRQKTYSKERYWVAEALKCRLCAD